MTNLKNPSAKDLSKKPPAKNQKPSNSKWKRDFKYSVSDNDSYYAGPANAKVVITEFSDYYWPYCRKAVSLVDDIIKKYPNDVKVVFIGW